MYLHIILKSVYRVMTHDNSLQFLNIRSSIHKIFLLEINMSEEFYLLFSISLDKITICTYNLKLLLHNIQVGNLFLNRYIILSLDMSITIILLFQ